LNPAKAREMSLTGLQRQLPHQPRPYLHFILSCNIHGAGLNAVPTAARNVRNDTPLCMVEAAPPLDSAKGLSVAIPELVAAGLLRFAAGL